MPLNEPRYRVAWAGLVDTLLPSLLRRPRLKAYLEALTAPVAELHGRLLSYIEQTRRELSYNGQTMNLERALNDRFDPALRRIYITDNDVELEQSYDNFVAEAQPWQYMTFAREAPPWLYDYLARELLGQVGFIVHVPVNLRPQEVAIHARVKQLKLALIKHSIQYI